MYSLHGNGIEGMAGYVGFVCVDQISKFELLSMTKEFKLDMERCGIWWLDGNSENGGFREIVTNLDAVTMGMLVDSSRKVYACIDIRYQGVDSWWKLVSRR